MPRGLPGVVGTLLAIAALVPAPLASAQIFSRLFRGQQAVLRNNRREAHPLFSEEDQRLAEMKVELALLSDIATFPYDLRAHANGDTLTVRGSVPNETIRQRAMELARRNTYLRGIDELTIQPNLSVRSLLRPPYRVQQEGIELLQKELGEPARQMSLEVRPNGVVVLTGRVDSVESKREISRLFRRLPGCTAVINELNIEPVLRDGQRVVQVTRDGSLFVSPSALELALGPSLPAGLLPPPTPNHTDSLTAQEDEGHQPNLSPKPDIPPLAAEKIGNGWEAFAPSKLPVKWGRPASGWQGQMAELEAAHGLPTAASPLPKPVDPPWTAQSIRASDKMPTPIPPAEVQQGPNTTLTVNKPGRARSHPNFAEARETPEEGVLTWQRPSGGEESEPKTTPPAPEAPLPTKELRPVSPDVRTLESAPPPVPSLHSPRRWPP